MQPLFPAVVASVACVCAAAPASAVPSEAEIVERLTHADTVEVRVSSTPGKRHTSADRDGASVRIDDYWARGVTIVRKAKLDGLPDARIEVTGSVRYDILPDGFSYREFKGSGSRYLGLPLPTEEEVVALLRARASRRCSAARSTRPAWWAAGWCSASPTRRTGSGPRPRASRST